MVNLSIGSGTNPVGTFSAIDWSAGTYYIKIELDITGGTSFSDMGASQLLSVPYALFAASGTQGPQGIQGISGTNGTNGTNGLNGQDGVSITTAVVQNDTLHITLSTGQILHAGLSRQYSLLCEG